MVEEKQERIEYMVDRKNIHIVKSQGKNYSRVYSNINSITNSYGYLISNNPIYHMIFYYIHH